MPRYWVVLAALDHAERGKAGGFVQANHGKLAALKRMQSGDGVVVYSPVREFGGRDRLQAFTLIGTVRAGEPYRGDMGGGFRPYRRDMDWRDARLAPIRPLLDRLSFTRGVANWGQRFRFGMFGIDVTDFEIVAQAMGAAFDRAA